MDQVKLNPSLEISKQDNSFVIKWMDNRGQRQQEQADNDDLLAVKIFAEELFDHDNLEEQGISAAKLQKVLRYGLDRGFLVAPQSQLIRDQQLFSSELNIPDRYLTARDFTIQWHITNDCDLHCKHCYDRSKRSTLTLEQGNKILDDLQQFCDQKNVFGHVTFSGGNPFMSPYFFQLYELAAQKGFSTSILGNAVPKKLLEKMIGIQHPGFYQVSLEGLQEHNDDIRGQGYYQKVLGFLKVLKELNIESAVMLTLTRDNIDQVLPLAEELKDKADYFTFNRLSPVGEGAELVTVGKEQFQAFITKYVAAAEENSIIGFKDNLINIDLSEKGQSLSSGCTGYGCGAAFNFVAILPDGQVEACRKFESTIGNINKDSLLDIYDSQKAEKYRRGSLECDGCKLRHVCGGCLAISDGQELDFSKTKDPYCWQDN